MMSMMMERFHPSSRQQQQQQDQQQQKKKEQQQQPQDASSSPLLQSPPPPPPPLPAREILPDPPEQRRQQQQQQPFIGTVGSSGSAKTSNTNSSSNSRSTCWSLPTFDDDEGGDDNNNEDDGKNEGAVDQDEHDEADAEISNDDDDDRDGDPSETYRLARKRQRQTTTRPKNHDDDEDDEALLRLYGTALEGFQRLQEELDEENGNDDGQGRRNSDDDDDERTHRYLVGMQAQCWRRMGEIHSARDRLGPAVLCWKQCSQLYIRQSSKQRDLSAASDGGDGGGRSSSDEKALAAAAAAATGGTVCFDAMIVETLQKRADVHLRLLHSASGIGGNDDDDDDDSTRKKKRITAAVEGAIECHQEAVRYLMELNATLAGEWGQLRPNRSVQVDGDDDDDSVIVVESIGKEHHTELLMSSIESLSRLYRKVHAERGEMVVFEDALALLRERQSGYPDHHPVAVSIARILTNLADVYVEMGEIDAAFDSLDEAIDVFVVASSTSSPVGVDDEREGKERNGDVEIVTNSSLVTINSNDEATNMALEAMDMVGSAYEESKCYEQAMACYEKVLLVRNQLLGNSHLSVAQSLVQVARVMELQGNLEGSLDLYRAAQSIYANHLSSDAVDVEKEDVQTLLELFPTAMEQGRYEEVIGYLSKCVEVAEDEAKVKEFEMDKTYVYYNLGKAYVGLQDFVSATICLMEAAKHEGDVSEEQIFALLQHVEFLQRQAPPRTTRRSSAPPASDFVGLADHRDAGDSMYATDNENLVVTTMEPTTPVSPFTVTSSDDGGAKNRNAIVPSEPRSPGTCSKTTAKSDEGDEEEYHTRGSGSVEDDEGTAYYDSESVSAFDPVPKADSHDDSDEGSSNLLEDSLLMEFEDPPIDVIPSESELDGSQISLPMITSSHTDFDFKDPLSHLSSASSAKVEEFPETDSRERGLSPTGASLAIIMSNNSRNSLDMPSNQPVLAEHDDHNHNHGDRIVPRSSLAKTLTGKFRRQRKGEFDPAEGAETTGNQEEDAMSPGHSLPSEEEYHAALEGPVQYVTVPPSLSWDSGVSQITMRIEDPFAKDSSQDTSLQEWWWGITGEGFARWFPTSYVSKAVEAAEGFLSAKAIHSKKKISTLEYLSDDSATSSDNIEGESVEVKDHPSAVGITDAYTAKLKGVNGKRASAKGRPRNQSALSVYSGRPREQRQPKQSKEMEGEISRYTSLVKRQREKGPADHPELATLLFTLAVLHSRNRASAPAIESAAEALRIQKAAGKFDDASRSLHFLADMYLHQKQYSTALTFYSEALRLERNYFGEQSDEAATTLNCIGTVHSLQNDFARAMDSHQEALRVLKDCHGEDPKHPLVSETLCQIGAVYYRERNSYSKKRAEDYTTFIEAGMLETIGRAHEDRGAYKMAMSFFEEKLQFLENRKRSNYADEDDLEDIAATLNSLGMLSSRAGFLVEAIAYYEKSIKIQRKLGFGDVQLASARVLIGSVYYQIGDFQKALEFCEGALDILTKELGTEHQTVAAALYHLGVVQGAMFQLNTAMTTLRQALHIQSRQLGADHPATLRTRREIASLFSIYESGSDTALEQLDDILAVQRMIHGDRHPNIAESLHCIGRAYFRRGDYARYVYY